MGKRIADSERIERVREYARQSSARRRVKLTIAGKMQLLCWIPSELRAQLDATAAQRNQNLSAVTTALLSAALSPSLPAPASSLSVDTLPLFDPAPVGLAIGNRLQTCTAKGYPNYAIADQVGCSEPTVRRALKRLNQEATE